MYWRVLGCEWVAVLVRRGEVYVEDECLLYGWGGSGTVESWSEPRANLLSLQIGCRGSSTQTVMSCR